MVLGVLPSEEDRLLSARGRVPPLGNKKLRCKCRRVPCCSSPRLASMCTHSQASSIHMHRPLVKNNGGEINRGRLRAGGGKFCSFSTLLARCVRANMRQSEFTRVLSFPLESFRSIIEMRRTENPANFFSSLICDLLRLTTSSGWLLALRCFSSSSKDFTSCRSCVLSFFEISLAM